MINAESDLTFPLETSQKPMFAHLGIPPEHKRHIIFPVGNVRSAISHIASA